MQDRRHIPLVIAAYVRPIGEKAWDFAKSRLSGNNTSTSLAKGNLPRVGGKGGIF